ncbi:hypothetical protein [Actinoplanes sp. L3-i22]|uniref:hypothetical protein n=1 Tax=Actinoplanes sp. L3-i22 TaxID=2836373 RepID=UPI001C75D6D8|nr:hypothetical protein [Actinoplanes sp. L3-i22]BCY08359.1 hypothetical protein L3i22_034470 [Actinoplanes sp. L3-i22]
MGQGKRAIGPMEIAGIAIVAILVAVAVFHRMNAGPEGNAADAAYPAPSGYSGLPAKRTGTPAPSAANAGPFAGTPAGNYAKGEAGLVMPAAKAVPGFTVAEVRAGLADVRAAMIAGRLDQRMLVQHEPSVFLGLVAPSSRSHLEPAFKDGGQMTLATYIDPAVKLDPAEQPRVNGTVTFTSVQSGGVPTLQVKTNFLWVYAFIGGYPRIAAVHDEITWQLPSAKNLAAADKGLWIRESSGYTAWMDCEASKKGLLRPGVSTDPEQTGATEDPEAALDSAHSLDVGSSCN